MAIEFNSFTNNIFNSINSIPFLNGILSNVLYTSIILTIILIIILLFIYPCEEGTPPWILCRMFLYLVIVNTLVFSAHQSVLTKKYNEKYTHTESDTFITNINRKGGNSIYHSDNIKVVPKFTEFTEFDNNEEKPDNTTKEMTISDILDDVENCV